MEATSISSFPPSNMVTGLMNRTFHYGPPNPIKALLPWNNWAPKPAVRAFRGQGCLDVLIWRLLYWTIVLIQSLWAGTHTFPFTLANIPSVRNMSTLFLVQPGPCFIWAYNIVTHKMNISRFITNSTSIERLLSRAWIATDPVSWLSSVMLNALLLLPLPDTEELCLSEH